MEGLQVDVLVPAEAAAHRVVPGELGRIQYDNVEAFGLPESAKRYERISRYVSYPRAINPLACRLSCNARASSDASIFTTRATPAASPQTENAPVYEDVEHHGSADRTWEATSSVNRWRFSR